MLDDLDRRILRNLQNDPEQSIPDLANLLGLTASRLSRRLEKLRDEQGRRWPASCARPPRSSPASASTRCVCVRVCV